MQANELTEQSRLFGLLPTAIVAFALTLGVTSIDAQFYFGRNKIQYEEFDWQVLETPHFQIYYYTEEETVARAAAYWAEESFVDLEQKFNHTLRRKVPLVIYSNHSHFQQTNTTSSMLPEGVGGFFEFLKGRVVLPYRGSMYDFWHVVRHEMVHVFMHSKINAAGNRVGSWDRQLPPAWFTEGLAEWWSIGWDSQAEMVIRDALLHDHLYPVENLTVGGAGFLVYKEGQAFSKFLEEEYGADVIRQIMDEFYNHETFEEVVEAVTSKSFSQLSKQWRLSLKRSTAERLIEDRLPGEGIEKFTESGANVSPTLYVDSEGKSHVVYLSSRDGYASVYKQALGSTKGERVLRGERTSDLESLHFMQSGLGVNNEGILAFVAKSFARDHIRLVDLETGNKVGEYSSPDLVTLRSPAWSPDGKQIVFSAQDKGGRSDLYLWDVDTDTSSALTEDFYLDRDPVFDPTGDAILFTSDRGRPQVDVGTSIFRYDLATGEFEALTTGPYKDSKPRQSTTGEGSIQFISDRSGTPNIWQVAGGTSAPLSIAPVTDLHTGAVDFMQLPGDTLLLTTFEEYGFQIQMAIEDSIRSTRGIQSPASSAAFAAYEIPRYDGAVSGEDSQPYRRRYSLDFAQTALTYSPVFGALGGLQFSVSDILGNRFHHFMLANSAERAEEYLKHPNFAFTSVNLTRRFNYAFGAFQFAREYGSFFNLEETYFERVRGVRAGIDYPLDVFKRIEFSTTTWRTNRDYYFSDGHTESALLTNMYASFVHDNALWYGVGPFDGWRFRVTTGVTYNADVKGVRNYQLLLDNRVYVRLSPRVALAQRTTFGVNSGRDTYRSFIGGSWGMRGYDISEVAGRRYLMFNQEIRFPFANSLALRTNTIAIGFAPIRGAFFVDVGNAWESEVPDFIGSAGFGLRGVFMGALVLRMDIGRKFNFANDERPKFVRYFFGWDF